jgi:hypothetical protein
MPSLRLLVGSAVTAAGLSLVALAAPASAAPVTSAPPAAAPAARVVATKVTPDQRAAASRAALLKATSVRVRVKTTYLGGPLTADLRVAANQCEGVFNGSKLGVMRVRLTGGVVFFTGDDTLWKNATGAADPAPFRGKWAATTLKDAKYGSLFRMCTPAGQADGLYPKGLKFAAAKAKVVDGKATVAIVSVKTKVTVYISAKGAAYPLMQVNKTGWVRYQEWNAPVAPVVAPADELILA